MGEIADAQFYSRCGHNQFDNLAVDVEALYREHPISSKTEARPNAVAFSNSRFHRIYRSPVIPLRYRERLWHMMRQVHLDLSWFQEFDGYWSSVLGGRPLCDVEDFYFLKNLYRVKFQSNQVPDTKDAHVHLQAWQRPELLYQLLHLVHREAVANQLVVLRHLFRLRKGFDRLLEFGCGSAPITASLCEFYRPSKELKIYISDIQTLAFHYAAYRFRECANVTPILLQPDDDFALTIGEPLDAVFCMAVFEHLNRPLDTARRFHDLLKPGGLLFFDYIVSTGGGMDTLRSVEERSTILEYIDSHFKVLEGTLSKGRSMGLTIVRKE